MKVIDTNNIGIGLNFVLEYHESISFKPYVSASLTTLFVHEEVLGTQFGKNGTSHLRNVRQHIKNHLQGRNLTFYVWCKPAKDEENYSYAISKRNIAHIEIDKQTTIEQHVCSGENELILLCLFISACS